MNEKETDTTEMDNEFDIFDEITITLKQMEKKLQ